VSIEAVGYRKLVDNKGSLCPTRGGSCICFPVLENLQRPHPGGQRDVTSS